MRSSQYRRISKLGKGSFGEVHLVEKQETKELFALKKIDNLNKFNDIPSILNEIALLQELHHPNIIKYHECLKDGHRICLLMEYADNGDLGQRVHEVKKSKLRFSETIILNWIAQLSLALSYLHKRHIIHRDIKLQNIFITKEGLIKLGDFGVSKKLDKTDEMAYTTLGTPYYISPEICQGYPYNNKSDIWMLGCVLFELCNLEKPFSGCSLHTLVKKIVEDKHIKICNKYSPFLQNLVDCMLEKDPVKRPKISDILEKEEIKKEIRILKKKYPHIYNDYLIDEIPKSFRTKENKSISFHDYLMKRTQSIQIDDKNEQNSIYLNLLNRKYSVVNSNIEKSIYKHPIIEEDSSLAGSEISKIENNKSKKILEEKINENNKSKNITINLAEIKKNDNMPNFSISPRIGEHIVKTFFKFNENKENYSNLSNFTKKTQFEPYLLGKNQKNERNPQETKRNHEINISFDEFSKLNKKQIYFTEETKKNEKKEESPKRSISLDLDIEKKEKNSIKFAEFLSQFQENNKINEIKQVQADQSQFRPNVFHMKNYSVMNEKNDRNNKNMCCSFLDYVNEKMNNSKSEKITDFSAFKGEQTLKKKGIIENQGLMSKIKNNIQNIKHEKSIILANNKEKKNELINLLNDMSNNGNSKSFKKLFYLLGNIVSN